MKYLEIETGTMFPCVCDIEGCTKVLEVAPTGLKLHLDEYLVNAIVEVALPKHVKLVKFVAGETPDPAPTLIAPGKTVLCACGDPACYKAVEVLWDEIMFYEDRSDRSVSGFIIELPDHIALVKV